MTEAQLLSQVGLGVGLIIALWWVKSLQAQLDKQAATHGQEIERMQQRLDRMQERQNLVFDKILTRTDLGENSPTA